MLENAIDVSVEENVWIEEGHWKTEDIGELVGTAMDEDTEKAHAVDGMVLVGVVVALDFGISHPAGGVANVSDSWLSQEETLL